MRAVLWAEGNIPEITEKVQFVIKNRLQEMLGIEENISVRVHVSKILPREEHPKKKPDIEQHSVESPFHGTIEYKK